MMTQTKKEEVSLIITFTKNLNHVSLWHDFDRLSKFNYSRSVLHIDPTYLFEFSI